MLANVWVTLICVSYGIPMNMLEEEHFNSALFEENRLYDEAGYDITEDLKEKRIFPLYYSRTIRFPSTTVPNKV